MSLEGIREAVKRESDKPLSLDKWLDIPTDPFEIIGWLPTAPLMIPGKIVLRPADMERAINTTIAELDPVASAVDFLADIAGRPIRRIRR